MPMPNGKTRCGSFVSPAEKVTYCHPSYAHKTPIIARPTPAKSDPFHAAGQTLGVRAKPFPTARSIALMMRMPATLIAVATPCTFAPCRVPHIDDHDDGDHQHRADLCGDRRQGHKLPEVVRERHGERRARAAADDEKHRPAIEEG